MTSKITGLRAALLAAAAVAACGPAVQQSRGSGFDGPQSTAAGSRAYVQVSYRVLY